MSVIKEQIEVIKEKDPAIKSTLEVFLYPSFYAVSFHSLSHRLYEKKYFFLARLISQVIRGFTGIEIHPGATIGKRLFIDHGMGVVIGETCEIGDDVTIYHGVTLGGTGKDKGKRHPTIGNNVMISTGAKILGPFYVGDNARIAANAVVLQEVPEDSTVVGIPGKVVRIKGKRIDEETSSKKLDQVHIPDPIQMQLCDLATQIEDLQERLRQMESLVTHTTPQNAAKKPLHCLGECSEVGNCECYTAIQKEKDHDKNL
jgi:serine O-acetyltransferase